MKPLTLSPAEKADLERNVFALWHSAEGKKVGRLLLTEKGKAEGDLHGALNVILETVKDVALRLYNAPPPRG